MIVIFCWLIVLSLIIIFIIVERGQRTDNLKQQEKHNRDRFERVQKQYWELWHKISDLEIFLRIKHVDKEVHEYVSIEDPDKK